MSRSVTIVLIAGLVAGSSTSAYGAQKFPPDKFVNLQVFPKDSSPDVVIAAMKNFTRYLGVRCPYCHVGEEGMPLDKFDFASDTKPQKNVARMMIRMSGEISAQITKAIPDASTRGQVTCFTCHRGQPNPVHAP